MKLANPYLNFNGQTLEAFEFYKTVFGTDFEGPALRFRDFGPPGWTSPNMNGTSLRMSPCPSEETTC